MDPLTIFLITATALSGGVGAYGQVQAGKSQKMQLREQARQEELASRKPRVGTSPRA